MKKYDLEDKVLFVISISMTALMLIAAIFLVSVLLFGEATVLKGFLR